MCKKLGNFMIKYSRACLHLEREGLSEFATNTHNPSLIDKYDCSIYSRYVELDVI